MLSTEHDLFRDDPLLDDALLVIQILEEKIQRLNPLNESALHLLPFPTRDDAWDQVEGEDSLGPLIIAVNGEGDALIEKGIRGQRLLAFDLAISHFIEALEESPVVRSDDAGRAKHLIVEVPNVVVF